MIDSFSTRKLDFCLQIFRLFRFLELISTVRFSSGKVDFSQKSFERSILDEKTSFPEIIIHIQSFSRTNLDGSFFLLEVWIFKFSFDFRFLEVKSSTRSIPNENASFSKIFLQIETNFSRRKAFCQNYFENAKNLELLMNQLFQNKKVSRD